MKTAVRCETCRWWTEGLPRGIEGFGMCRRAPTSPSSPMETADVWWCGEWAHDPRRFEVMVFDDVRVDDERSFFALCPSVRTWNCLEGYAWDKSTDGPRHLSIREVSRMTDRQLRFIKGIGGTVLREIRWLIVNAGPVASRKVRRIKNRETGEFLPVLWPWEIPEYEGKANQQVEGA